ncbi:glycoside hydrolase superfamily [Cladochytrium replicatum]|nr:glycoside hydrolase superfamily [Cladochytrium replicatum]
MMLTAFIAAAVLASQVAASPVLVARQNAGSSVTVTIDPSYQQPEFQGWGTSLAWLGVKTGGYSDEVRTKLADLLFGPNGLNLNIARYNVGGGNAPTVKDYLRPGGAVPGWWKADKAYGPNDKDWWNPANASHWDFDADPNQRWWIDQIKDKVTIWEAFSNSPPWFHTVSGYVSGGFSSTAEQIRENKLDEFATYMVKVVEHLEKTHGIKFATIEPVNEPNTNYWGTNLGSDGIPTGGRQEGCHVGPSMMSKLFLALKKALATAATKAVISAPDETNPTTFLTDFYGFSSDAVNAITQLNVHTYGTSGRISARDVAKSAQKPLWMSEIEGSWGKTFTGMDSGLGMAQQIVNDIRELEPSAWVLWQPIEDFYNMIAEGNLQWGEIHVPFNCSSTDGLDACPIKTNTKFHTIRQFTHYIRPGDRIVKVSDTSSLAAIKGDGTGAVLVHVNNQNTTREVSLDLSNFGSINSGATITPITTSDAGALVKGSPISVSGNSVKITVPMFSVTTFLVSGVSGVSDAAPLAQDGKYYSIKGVQSGKVLQVSNSGTALVINTASGSNRQLWTFRSLDSKFSNRNRYAIVNAETKTRLAVTSNGGVIMQADSGSVPESAQWMVSTGGDGTYTLVSIGVRAVMDVGGQATGDNSPVGTYQPNTGTNQRWTFSVGTLAPTTTTPAPTGTPTTSLTVQVDPSYQHPEFQGWGSSLAWLGVKTGGYADEVRTKLVDLIFGENGLRLNIARYNVGGGNAPTVKDYLRPGGAVPGWWRAPQAYGPNDKDWWDVNNPDHWNFDADPNQRWWIDQIKDKVTRWEAFSNSPPWFQTVSGYVSGGFDATSEQIRDEKLDDFAAYMVKVAEHLEKAHGIKFDTIEPINEPNTNYWSTKLNGDGVPTGGRQEGCHVGPEMQGKVFLATKRALANSTLRASLSAPDETNPGTFLKDWYGYTSQAIDAVSQLNVHTYGTESRMPVRDLAKAALKPLWMSEVEGSWGSDYTSMDSGLGMAQLIVDDLRELEPHAWVLWQPVEGK